MRVLIIGATGMLGQALMKEAFMRKIEAVGTARSGTDLSFNLTDDYELKQAVKKVRPDMIINTAAIVNLLECEKDPGLAYRVNARSVGLLAEMSRKLGIYFIQISTDHYFTGDGSSQHKETCPVRLVNEYARTKLAGEYFALTCPESLVIRTNIVGFRRKCGHLALVEWVLKTLESGVPITLFDDFFTSSIDVRQFSVNLFDLIEKKPRGIINLASREVVSKKTFIEALATQLGYSLAHAKIGSVFEIPEVERAESLGLDISMVEAILGYPLPTLDQVVRSLVAEYKES